MTASRATEQLAALARVGEQLEKASLEHWLFGGWAVDFHVGEITRTHDDLDLAVWSDDVPRIAELLAADGWRHAPHEDEDGGTGFEREGARLELTFLVRDETGAVFVQLRAGRAPWSDDAVGADVLELESARARVVPLEALTRDKSTPRTDALDAAKDRADLERLARVRP